MAAASRVRRTLSLALALVLLALSGCSLLAARAPRASAAAAPATSLPAGAQLQGGMGDRIAAAAAALIGTRYEFGGADLGGFDCSGLALYVYERAGISIPRTAAEQQHAAQPVPLSGLARGDLMFFSMGGRRIDHVGIYIGGGRFVHAPHQGVAVSSAELANGYYARHLVNAGRFVSVAVSSR
jgi:cell wall-associated NlpC family hydrolase